MIKWISLVLLIAVPCIAQETNCCHRTISTTGTGEVKVKPDQAVVRMQIESRHKTADTAKQEVDQRLNRFLQALEPLNIDQDDIVAASLSILPEYEYRDRQRLFSGYMASRSLTVTLRQLEHMDTLLDIAVTNGVNQVLSITPESSREEELRLQAHKNAIADSQVKARELAKAYGAELGAIFTINYSNPQVHYPVAKEAAQLRMMSADSGGGDGQYLYDQLIFSDNIYVVFDLIIPD